jgi:hypothetical protein
MSEIDRLLARYAEHIAIPWSTARSDIERTLFVIYDRSKERQLRFRVGEFQARTEAAGKQWLLVDVTDAFANWFAAHDYRDEYFKYPEDQPGYKEGRLQEFEDHLARDLAARLKQDATPEHVVAVLGAGSLFGVARVSALMKRIAATVPGRLLVFFPGEKTDNNYRLLGARDGWDYLATAVTAD